MVDMNQMDDMLTIREVSRLLHVHPNTLRRWSDDGRLKAYRITLRGDRRFRHHDVINLIEEMGNQAYFEKSYAINKPI
jgi:excisionase family DNA binding protein